jgi:hypothetical protein
LLQTVAGLGKYGNGLVITGNGLTVTVTDFEEEHPFASVPITVYVVVIPGTVVTDEPVDEDKSALGLQMYVEAPLAVRVIIVPWQIVVEGVTVIVMFGLAFTVTVTEAVLVQPLAPVPVTV